MAGKGVGGGGAGRSISLAASRAKLAAATASAKKAAATTASGRGKGKGKAAKKVFSLTGQKFDIPEEFKHLIWEPFLQSISLGWAGRGSPFGSSTNRSPSRSHPATWPNSDTTYIKPLRRLMEHGLLSPERAKKAYDRKLKRQQQIKSGTPIKSSNSNTVSKHNNNKPAETWKKPAPVVSSSSTARHNTDHTAAKAKRRVEYSSDDDDKEFIVKLKRPNFNSNSNSSSRGG
uniref:Uncharacterized protein n=1 Tax=Aegilops tauschii TaxID=37682 RepID=M8BKZ8_AEGTA